MIAMMTLVLALQTAAAPQAPAQTTVVTPQIPVTRSDDSDPRRRPPGGAHASGPNVRVDVTLSESGGTGPAAAKTVTVTTNDNTFGKLRTQVTSRAYGAAPLNVDVLPRVQPNGSVLVTLTIEYSQGRNPDTDGNPDRIMNVSLNQSASLLLESGKPMTLSQSADPIGDRKVTVEVKATVLKN